MMSELASLLDDLNRLKRSPQPPQAVDQFIDRLAKAMGTIKTP
ncbi:MAG: hypothetical protein ACYDBJ_01325 [Aggregatilineales bacterium]